MVINTHKGLFRYNRPPFGVTAAPAIFQRTIEGVLQGIPCLLGRYTHYRSNCKRTLGKFEQGSILSERGWHAVKAKQVWLPAVEYLGHHISAEGLRPTEEKIRAIVDAPAPQDVTQLHAFLGLINYYGKFVGQLSSILAPLLEKNTKWVWRQPQQTAFQTAKNKLISAGVLTHFNPEQKLIFLSNASPDGYETDQSEVTMQLLSDTLAEDERKGVAVGPVPFASQSSCDRLLLRLYFRTVELRWIHTR